MSTPTNIASATERENAELASADTFGGHLSGYLAKIRGGDMGALPAVLGIVVLSVIFTFANSNFLTARNFANLFTQGAAVTIIAMGLVFVLLLGEIDLAAGYTSGVAAAVLATLQQGSQHRSTWVIILAALLTGAAIGLVQGLLVAKIGIPSFVVTLAGFLAWQGVVLLIVGEGGNIVIHDKLIVGVVNNNVPPTLGWILFALTVVAFGTLTIGRVVRRRARGLVAEPLSIAVVRVAALAVGGGFAVYILNQNRGFVATHPVKGMPWVIPLIGVLLVIGTFVLDRTTYGRHVYATGGNTEGARRAGIRTDAIRTSVFVLCSTFAAIGGIVAASRLASVDPQAGGGNTLLFAVGAAVIGGTSLFGGKGKMRDAVLGGAVVAIIYNGMGLIGWKSDRQFIATGIVLLVAAGVDALSRRRAMASGRR